MEIVTLMLIYVNIGLEPYLTLFAVVYEKAQLREFFACSKRSEVKFNNGSSKVKTPVQY